jgi:hypothetical protein
METTWTIGKLVIAALAVFGGWAIVGGCLWIIRKTVVPQDAPESFAWLDFWLGATERGVALGLMLWAKDYLPAFIGAWVAAKLAANWLRLKSEDIEVRRGHLIALIGSALSFALAIGAAVLIQAIGSRAA